MALIGIGVAVRGPRVRLVAVESRVDH